MIRLIVVVRATTMIPIIAGDVKLLRVRITAFLSPNFLPETLTSISRRDIPAGD